MANRWTRSHLGRVAVAAIFVGAFATIGLSPKPAEGHPFGSNHGEAATATWAGLTITNSTAARSFVGVPNMQTPTNCGALYVVVVSLGCGQIDGANARPIQVVATGAASGDFAATGLYSGCISALCSGLNPDNTPRIRQYMDGACFGVYFFVRDNDSLGVGTSPGMEISWNAGSARWQAIRGGVLQMQSCNRSFQGFTAVGVESGTGGTMTLNMDENSFWGTARRDHLGGWYSWHDPSLPDLNIAVTNHHATCALNVNYGTFLGTTITGTGAC